MLKGIVAFEMDVDDLQGKMKLSQNKLSEERARIATHLAQSHDGSARAIGEFMQNL